jgi:DNA-binding SARP family transcriptional activator
MTADRVDAEPTPPPELRRRAVRIQVLGEPAIFDRAGTAVTGLRRHARQLLVYLAVHRDGADLPQIMEAFWPTATLRRAGERLSTEVGHLRSRIRQAAGDTTIQPVINTGGRYVLNTEVLDIDLWRMSDALRRAGAATDRPARIAALREAVDAHTGGLADGQDYDWIEPFREQVRRHGVRARMHLADLLVDTDPDEAATLAETAADLDGYNEDAARHAMRILARIGDAAGIRDRLQRLRDALDDIDEEPAAETITLAAQLQKPISPSAEPRFRDHAPDGHTSNPASSHATSVAPEPLA